MKKKSVAVVFADEAVAERKQIRIEYIHQGTRRYHFDICHHLCKYFLFRNLIQGKRIKAQEQVVENLLNWILKRWYKLKLIIALSSDQTWLEVGGFSRRLLTSRLPLKVYIRLLRLINFIQCSGWRMWKSWLHRIVRRIGHSRIVRWTGHHRIIWLTAGLCSGRWREWHSHGRRCGIMTVLFDEYARGTISAIFRWTLAYFLDTNGHSRAMYRGLARAVQSNWNSSKI